jgi:hypothetical protein
MAVPDCLSDSPAANTAQNGIFGDGGSCHFSVMNIQSKINGNIVTVQMKVKISLVISFAFHFLDSNMPLSILLNINLASFSISI